MPPTRPLVIWELVAIACAALLSAEGALSLSGRYRRVYGWRQGALMMVGGVITSALAARLSDIHAELIRTQCNCEPFQWTDPRIATPLVVATLLGSAALALTIYGSARALRIVRISRHPAAPLAERAGARAWPLSGSLVALALLMDVGAWITANGVVRLAETAYLIDPARQGDGLGILPLFDAISSSLCGAILLIVPLSLIVRALLRSGLLRAASQ